MKNVLSDVVGDGVRLLLVGCACAALVTLPGCKKGRAPKPDGINVLAAVTGEDGAAKTVTVDGKTLVLTQWLPETDAVSMAAADVLASTVGLDGLKVLQLTRALTLSRVTEKDPASVLQRAVAQGPVAVVVGAPDDVVGLGIAIQDAPAGKPAAYPQVMFVSLPKADAAVEDGSLEQVLLGKVARLALATALFRTWQKTTPAQRAALHGHPAVLSDPVSALLEGFDLHMQTQVRKLSTSGKLSAANTVERAKTEADVRAAGVLTNRYVYRLPEPGERLRTDEARTAWVKAVTKGRPPTKGPLWTGSQMTCVAGVAAAVFNNLVEDPEVAFAVPAQTFFAPMFPGGLPKDFKASAFSTLVLGHLKLMHAVLERLNRADATAYPGVNSLLEAYGAEFVPEKKAAQRALLHATMARTASTQGTTGVEGGSAVVRITQEVLEGGRFADGAVGPTLMLSFRDVPLHGVDGRVVPLTFTLNAPFVWQLELIPGFLKEDADRLAARIEKSPLERVDELAGTIPAESFAALRAASVNP